MTKIYKLFSFSFLLSFLLSGTGCKRFVVIPPPKDQLVSSSVYQDEATATAAILGIYEKMQESPGYFSNGGITFYCGLSADELIPTPVNSVYNEFFQNRISPTNPDLKNKIWGNLYQIIFQANAALEGLSAAAFDSVAKRQLTGEALFVRAFCDFYLVNLFGDIPLVTGTNYLQNAKLSRSPASKVYEEMISDLRKAVDLLAEDYLDGSNQFSTDRLRPNKAAAEALLARIYLYQKDWRNAELIAGILISQADRYPLQSDLKQTFLAGSTEAIWQLMPVLPNINTGEGSMFAQTSGVPVYGFLDSALLSSFEPGDLRASDWISNYVNEGITYYYPAKYKMGYSSSQTEYYTVFRIAEQYLIRAEARNEQQNVSGAAADLNLIRARANLNPATALDYNSMKYAIEMERRHELFCEWGNRWLDLKRTGRITDVLSAKKSSWESSAQLYPVPQTEIQNDQNISQNAGY